MFDKLDKSYRESLKVKRENEERFRRECKDKLVKNIETKIRTTFIGAISSIENHFGVLWGHGKVEEELNHFEKQRREIWQALRDEILNKGNLQLRNALAELHWYDVQKRKSNTKFIMEDRDV